MKYGFLFGAGAEVGYGLPSGGKFALDIFRHDITESKKKHSKKCEIMLIIQRDMHHIGCLTVSEIKILVHLEKPFFKILSKILLSTTVKI